MSQIVWLARHANRLDFVNPEWFNTAEHRYDPPLSEDGFEQAKQLAQRLKGEKIDHIFVSPFLRTVQTANAVAEVLDLPLKVETGLSEWLNPAWMMEVPKRLSIFELAKLFPRVDLTYDARVAAIYPETIEQMRKRSAATAKQLVKAYFPANILMVGHGASVLGAAMGLVPDMETVGVKVALCSLFKIVRPESVWEFELHGDTSHLTQTEEVIRLH